MTTQTAVFSGLPTGQTLTAKLFTLAAPDTVAYTADSVTERTNAKGEYVASFGEVAEISGEHTLILFNGSSPVAIGKRTFAGVDAEVATVTPEVAALPTATQTQIDNILDGVAWTLASLYGACANPQAADALVQLTIYGYEYSGQYDGLTSTGVRLDPTLSKV